MDMTGMQAQLLGLLQVEDTDRYGTSEAALNAEMRGLCKRHSTRYHWITAAISQAAGDEDMALPSRWKRTDRLTYASPVDGSLVTLLHCPSRERLDALYPPDTDDDYPKAFCISGSNIIMRPAPLTTLALTHEYWEIPADLTGAGTNALVTDHWEVIVYLAAAQHGALWIGEDERLGVFARIAERLERDYVLACQHAAGDAPRSTHAPGRMRGR